jgi:hypothetical protein
VQHAPTHRAEDPLAEPEARADDQEEDGEDRSGDRDPGGSSNPADLTRDLTRFGTAQLDMGDDEGLGRLDRARELFAQPRWRPSWSGRRRPWRW